MAGAVIRSATDRSAALLRQRVASLTAASSIEVSPRDELVGDGLRALFEPGTTVFVNHPASVTHHDIVAACTRLRRAGFVPVPHIAARRLISFTQASDFVRRAVAEAGVTRALIIAGDPDRPVGPFADARELVASGVVDGQGLGELVFAGYPEGHPRIDRQALDAALRVKLALCAARGLKASLITQFGFEPAPIRRWIEGIRAAGVACPVRVGVAGPASIATLAKFAVRCGIGASLRALGRGHAAFARILAETSPQMLIEALVAEEHPGAAFDGLHVFTFGGVRRTAEWLRASRESA
ncbi:MAG TPA: methylenetetrahydrofolate reductase [Stellaceae bacterium]|nr:methylenetetrahydrofolate reductase [Stellaceae bacterium]